MWYLLSAYYAVSSCVCVCGVEGGGGGGEYGKMGGWDKSRKRREESE